MWGTYLLCSLIGAGIAGAMWILLFVGQHSALPLGPDDWVRVFSITSLAGSLSGTVAFFCDAWTQDAPAPGLRRVWEAVGCAGMMALVAALVLSQRGLSPGVPLEAQTRLTLIMIGLPASAAFIVGLFVPHIYRTARYVARLRQADPPGSRAPQRPVATIAPAAIR